jgi:hypothetical protein
MTDDRFMSDYCIYADSLDVNALLERAIPVAGHVVWRVGEVTEFGVAQSSGVRIEVFVGGSPNAFHRAIREFLDREDPFLRTAQTFVTGNVVSTLSTSLFVLRNHLPVSIDLPVSLLKRLAERSIEWSVTGVPCSEDGEIATGGAPSNNEMQRTAPGANVRRR